MRRKKQHGSSVKLGKDQRDGARQFHGKGTPLRAMTASPAAMGGARNSRLPGDSGIIHQAPFADPKLDHAVQHTAVHSEPAAEFVEIERTFRRFHFR